MEGKNYHHPETQVVVVMVPLPAQGHLNQLLHLSHIISSYGLPVYYVGSSTHNHQAKLRLQGWDSTQTSNTINFHDLELPPYTTIPPNPDPNTHFPTHLQPLFDACHHLREPFSQLLNQLSLNFRRVIVISDSGMGSVVQDAKTVPNSETYIFNTISVFTIFLNVWGSFSEKPFRLSESVVPESVPSIDGCFSPEVFNFIISQQRIWGFESGNLHNTARVIEGRYIELLDKMLPDKKRRFAIGPLNPVEIKREIKNDRHSCLKWLDKQEKGSVIYISFGSITTMVDEQITELAKGLEKSGLKFIWVLKIADTGNIFSDQVRHPKLPEGYEEKVKDKGMVIRDWAPQLEILAHPSTGGFMSHCGWNSCMESISFGVPIVAWPMHSDQPRNAVLITEVLKIGFLVRDWEFRREVVSSSIIENVLRRLMVSEEGKEVRKRAQELGVATRASVAKDGASRLEMDSFISHITR